KIVMADHNELNLHGEYTCHELCDLIHLEGAKALAYYKHDFYAGQPALTINHFGKGKAYYVASRNKNAYNDTFYSNLLRDLNVKKVIETDLPEGVTAQCRTDGVHDFVFLMNFVDRTQFVDLSDREYVNVVTGEKTAQKVELGSFDVKVLKRNTES